MLPPLVRSSVIARVVTAWMLALAVAPIPADAQTAAGRLVGRIVDATSGRGISDAGIQVVGTMLGGNSGVEGRYRFLTYRRARSRSRCDSSATRRKR